MNGALYLAWRYIVFHRGKAALMVLGVAVTVTAPMALSVLIGQYEGWLTRRAQSTPLVIGSAGNRFDLVMSAVYFRPGPIRTVPQQLLEQLRETRLASVLPIHARFSVQGHPLIGTSIEYFDFRRLLLSDGRLPATLGEAVVGSAVAEELGVSPGDAILTDRHNVYNLAKALSLKVRIVGVLARTGGPDDEAVFVDVRTAWVVEGLGHGHDDVTAAQSDQYVLGRTRRAVVANDALPTYVEITERNVDSFHFHGDIRDFPLSAVIAIPVDERAATILKTRINAEGEYQALSPIEVTGELMQLVFRIRQFFDASFALVSVSVLLLLGLIVALSLRLRQSECATIRKMGGSRGTVAAMQIMELMIIAAGALIVAGIGSAVVLFLAPQIGRSLW